MKNKRIGLFVIILIALAAINIYTSNQRFDETGITIIMDDKKVDLLGHDAFENASPSQIEIEQTRQNGESSVATYYAVQLITVLNNMSIQEFDTIEAIAGDYFSAQYSQDELADNVYLAYNQEEDTYEIAVLKDEFATRFIKDIQEFIVY